MKKAIITSLALAAVATASAQDSIIAAWDFDGADPNGQSEFANWGTETGIATLAWTHDLSSFIPPSTAIPAEFGLSGAFNSPVTGNAFADFGIATDPGTGFTTFDQNDAANAVLGFNSLSSDDFFNVTLDASGFEGLTLSYVVNSSEIASLALADNFSGTFQLEAAANTTYDNFIVTGTVVPEPSTYAAIAGALALGFAAYYRRK